MRLVCEPNITPSGAGNAVPEQTRGGSVECRPFAFVPRSTLAYYEMWRSMVEHVADINVALGLEPAGYSKDRTIATIKALMDCADEMKKSKGKGKGGGKKC